MQGIKNFIPTEAKVRYIQSLLDVGFDTIDFGSFVSPKAIPQMRDTAKVVEQLDLSGTNTKLLAIIANLRGANDAVRFEQIDYLGYPFSLSEIFQMRNTAKTIGQSCDLLKEIMNLATKHNKKVNVYFSMGFGNPYGDPWSEEIVEEWVVKVKAMGVKLISLSDTVGTADADTIQRIFSYLIPKYPDIEFGAHLHTHPKSWYDKVNAAYTAGCRRFDSAIKGFGGCPMAKDELVGNLPTEKLLTYLTDRQIPNNIQTTAFENAYNEAQRVFLGNTL
ncbi:MAG TPA: hydroxymethylglutaryl-CoA lyase [Flavobacteriales bacterium]|nr:hydroxymethylglutaryl-CoA lyase [Flavobacteriales bacterium]